MKFLLCLLPLLTAGLLRAGHIEIRVSVKYFGATPDPSVATAAAAAVTNANRVLDLQGRGLRFKLQETVRLDPSLALPQRRLYISPSSWYPLELFSWGQWWQDSNPATPDQDEPPPPVSNVSRNQNGPYDQTIDRGDELAAMWREAVCSNKSTFAYRTNACNVYVIWDRYGGGVGSFPSSTGCTDNLFYVSALGDRSLFLHEWGHWADLQHPFASAEGTNDALGDDDIGDTPHDTWQVTPLIPPIFGGAYLNYINSVSQAIYGVNSPGLDTWQWDQVLVMGRIAQLQWSISGPAWPPLDAGRQAHIRLVWQNLMSYHKGAPPEEQWLFTEGQLDKIADSMAAYATRWPTATGRWWFFGGATTDGAAPVGSSKRPHLSFSSATQNNAALQAGDIVVGRPGSYTLGSTLRITKPCTIRATRGVNIPGAQSGAFSIRGN